MNAGLFIGVGVIVLAMVGTGQAEDARLTLAPGAEFELVPLIEQRLTQATEVSVQPRLAEETHWPAYCLLSIQVEIPGQSAGYSLGKLVCISDEREILEGSPQGEVSLGQCNESDASPCATLTLNPNEVGRLLLSEPLEMRLQPRNDF